MLNEIKIREVTRVFYQFNTIALKSIHSTMSLVNRIIVLRKKNIFKLPIKENHLMNNRKKVCSQEPNMIL